MHRTLCLLCSLLFFAYFTELIPELCPEVFQGLLPTLLDAVFRELFPGLFPELFPGLLRELFPELLPELFPVSEPRGTWGSSGQVWGNLLAVCRGTSWGHNIPLPFKI